MKKKLLISAKPFASVFFMVFIVFIPVVLYSQNPIIDSLKNEVLNKLNSNNLTFWALNQSGIGYYELKMIDNTTFVNNQLVFKTENETKSIDLIELSNCIYKEENVGVYILNALNLKKVISINFVIEGYPGTKKYERENKKRSVETNKLYNDLKDLQNKVRNEYYYIEATTFKAIANEYQLLKEKPSITEEQRKYIIQANALNEKKEYLNALIYYEKIILINPCSYPSGYYNIALIAAQINRFTYAIMSMKKYLMLLPGAEDARAAQDKIYEWELEIEKQ